MGFDNLKRLIAENYYKPVSGQVFADVGNFFIQYPSPQELPKEEEFDIVFLKRLT